MSQINFDATTVAPQIPRIAWPKGRYRVAIVSSEVKDVGAKNSGHKAVFFAAKALAVLGAPAGVEVPQSQILWNINYHNSNPDAQRIGQSELSSICHATGVLKLSDTQNLHGREFVIEVDQEFVPAKNEDGSLKVDGAGKPEGNHFNRIKGYFNADGSAIKASSATAPAAQVPAAAAPPAWAAEQPAAAPAVQAPVPTPAPVAAPTPVTLPPAPAAAVPEKLYYVSHAGKVVNAKPVNVDGIRALNLPEAEINVVEVGSQTWVKGPDFFASLAPAAPAVPVAPAAPEAAPAAPASVPPWMKQS